MTAALRCSACGHRLQWPDCCCAWSVRLRQQPSTQTLPQCHTGLGDTGRGDNCWGPSALAPSHQRTGKQLSHLASIGALFLSPRQGDNTCSDSTLCPTLDMVRQTGSSTFSPGPWPGSFLPPPAHTLGGLQPEDEGGSSRAVEARHRQFHKAESLLCPQEETSAPPCRDGGGRPPMPSGHASAGSQSLRAPCSISEGDSNVPVPTPSWVGHREVTPAKEKCAGSWWHSRQFKKWENDFAISFS